MADPMHGIESDVVFDDGTCDALVAAFGAAANRLDGHAQFWAGGSKAAGQGFEGHFADLFTKNSAVAVDDAHALAEQLSAVGTFARRLQQAAHEENARRARAREWQARKNRADAMRAEARHDRESGIPIIGDIQAYAKEREADQVEGVCDVPAPADPPVMNPPTVHVGARETPPPGSGGGRGGTTSAHPEALLSFAGAAGQAVSTLQPTAGVLSSHLAAFRSACQWGTLDASALVADLQAWMRLNQLDVHWVQLVGEAFARAGSEGGISTVSDPALHEVLASHGVAEQRQPVPVHEPAVQGMPGTTGFANDPVNVATGNFVEPEVDLAFGGGSWSLAVDRMYNSVAQVAGTGAPGVFGPGWSSILDMRLDLDETGAHWTMADGRRLSFPRLGDGWQRATGEACWLAREGATGFDALVLAGVATVLDELLVARDNEGCWVAFSSSGTWLGQGFGPGTAVVARRDQQGRVLRLEHERGRFVDVEHAGGVVVALRASDGRRVEFGYDELGRLVERRGAEGVRRYGLDERGLVERVVAADGVVEVVNGYDELGRVTYQLTEHGRQVRYDYLPGGVTQVSDDDGEHPNTWVSDPAGRLLRVVDGEDRTTSMAYDDMGNRVMVTERDGSVTVQVHDGRGRLVRRVTPEGEDITWGWDDQDRITTVVTQSGAVVEYGYEDDRQRDPSLVVDPAGGRTRLDWHDGLLRGVTGPTGVTMRFQHDELGDLVAVQDAVGGTTRLTRDAAGRVVAVTSPSGATTRMALDAAGNLVSRTDPDGSVWRQEFDHGNRLVAMVDPLGNRTTMEYGPGGDVVATVDPLGRRVERGIDEMGRVAELRLPDGSSWSFEHDEMSLVRRIVDPLGHAWLRDHDADGNLVRTIDPTGVESSVEVDRRRRLVTTRGAFGAAQVAFDEHGRPVRSTEPDGSSDLVVMDPAGRPVEFLDAEGGLTRVEYDLAGHVVRETSPAGRETSYDHDACGRPWMMTDPSGSVTRLEYDADSRVVAVSSPAGRETIRYDACGRVVRVDSPTSGVTRVGYDKAGRVTFVMDRQFGLRRLAYDAAGQLVRVTNGVGGVTHLSYDALGRLARLEDPAGAVTTREYDAMGNLVVQTDPLGRRTCLGYDAAGRLLWQRDADGTLREWGHRDGGLHSVSVDGRCLVRVARDALGRTLLVEDLTGPEPVQHSLVTDRLGRLVERRRGDDVVTWTYDADGVRTSMTAPTMRVRHELDAAGRVAAVDAPSGRQVLERDAAGRVRRVRIGGSEASWTHGAGDETHEVRQDGVLVDRVRTTRDDEGRVALVDSAAGITTYSYDPAGQLVEARTTRPDGRVERRRWVYDAAGRLVREGRDDLELEYTYDEGSQLVSITSSDGSRREFVHDALGRRVRESSSDGQVVEYTWAPLGRLAGLTRSRGGKVVEQVDVWVDALGELASVDGRPLLWDSASALPSLVGVGGLGVECGPMGVAVDGAAAAASSWSAARARLDEDPWRVPLDTGAPVLAGCGVVLTADGGVSLGGLEWMGARVYDPSAHGFLSTDPLDAVLGAGWAGNPYSFAGNDPVGQMDPLGLRPMTIDQLKAYNDSRPGLVKATHWVASATHEVAGAVHQVVGMAKAVGGWFKRNWQYVAAAAVVVAGVALCATGVGGPLGATILVGAAGNGLFTAAGQVLTGQPLDPKAIARDVAIGGASAAAGVGAARGVGMVASKVVNAKGVGLVRSGAQWISAGMEQQEAGLAARQFGQKVLDKVTPNWLYRPGPLSPRSNWALRHGEKLLDRGEYLVTKGDLLASDTYLKSLPGKVISGGVTSATQNVLTYASGPGPHHLADYARAMGIGAATGGLSPVASARITRRLGDGHLSTAVSLSKDFLTGFANAELQPGEHGTTQVVQGGLSNIGQEAANEKLVPRLPHGR